MHMDLFPPHLTHWHPRSGGEKYFLDECGARDSVALQPVMRKSTYCFLTISTT
jgi:hypothetical protein